MPINARTATANPDACRLDKRNARNFTVQVANQTCSYELNVAPFGRGETWMPGGGAQLVPGLWTFSQDDWIEYGVQYAQGIRFTSIDPADPAIITVS
jgi:hypothetical protein